MTNEIAEAKIEGTVVDLDELMQEEADNLNQEKETPEGSQPEQKTEEGDPSSQGDEGEEEEKEEPETKEEKEPEPNTEDEYKTKTSKRMQELLDDRKKANQEAEELKIRLEKLESNNETSEIPTAFKELYGDDENTYKMFNNLIKSEVNKQQEEFLSNLEKQQELAQQEQQEANQFVNDEILRLKSEGKKFDEKKLKNIMAEYKPTDDTGKILDFDKGYKLYEVLNKPDNSKLKARKKVADMTTPDNKTEPADKEYYTPGFTRRPGA